jgi:hypothetical protein
MSHTQRAASDAGTSGFGYNLSKAAFTCDEFRRRAHGLADRGPVEDPRRPVPEHRSGRALPLSFLFLGLGFTAILLGDRRRALHDVIAGTAVT